MVLKLFKRSTTSAPYYPNRTGPKKAGSYLFTLRSVPRHHDGILDVIEKSGANVYFSEPLAYLRGKGVALFRIESQRLAFLDDLYSWWRETESKDAFTFDISLYFNNNQFIASLRDHSPDEIRAMIEEGAPTTPNNPEDFQRTPYTTPAAAPGDRH